MKIIYLKHVRVGVLLVLDDHRVVARQCVRYGVLVGVQNGFGGGWRLDHIVLRSFDAVRLGALVQDEFGAPPAAIALRQEAIVTVANGEHRAVWGHNAKAIA